MKRALLPLAVALFGLLSLGCGLSLQLPPVTPATPPPADTHVPQCDAAAGKVSECWHFPGGVPKYNCSGGAPTVGSPAECPSAPKPTGCPIIEDDDAARVDQTQRYGSDYASAILAAQRVHPDWFIEEATGWRAPGAGDGGIYPTPPAVDAFRAGFFAFLMSEVAKSGLCGQLIGDELHIFDPKAAPIVSYRYKPFEYGAGRSDQKPYKGATKAAGSPGPAPTPKPGSTPPPSDPSTCDPKTPTATTFRLGISWNGSRTVAWVDASPQHNDREDDTTFCLDHYGPDGPWPDPRMLVVCPLAKEGAPSRKDCDQKHGVPVWFMALPNGAFQLVASDDGDPWHLHAPLGATVKACIAEDRACSTPVTLQ